MSLNVRDRVPVFDGKPGTYQDWVFDFLSCLDRHGLRHVVVPEEELTKRWSLNERHTAFCVLQ